MFDARSDLKHCDPDDIQDLILFIEKGYGVRFARDAFAHAATYGDLKAVVIQHLPGEDAADCTTQRAFYRLRQTATSVLNVPADVALRPETPLATLLPKRGRRRVVRAWQRALGVKATLVQPPGWVAAMLAWTLLLSLLMFGSSWKIALSGLLTYFVGAYAAHRLGNVLTQATLGDVARLLAREHYITFRRAGTVNRREVPKLIDALFSNRLGLPLTALTPDAPLFYEHSQ